MSRFASADSWGTNAGLTRRNWILCNELGESEPIFNLGVRKKVEELYKRIRYILIYSYKIRNRNNGIQIVGTSIRETSELEKLPYPRTVTDGMNLKDNNVVLWFCPSLLHNYALNHWESPIPAVFCWRFRTTPRLYD